MLPCLWCAGCTVDGSSPDILVRCLKWDISSFNPSLPYSFYHPLSLSFFHSFPPFLSLPPLSLTSTPSDIPASISPSLSLSSLLPPSRSSLARRQVVSVCPWQASSAHPQPSLERRRVFSEDLVLISLQLMACSRLDGHVRY